MFYGIPSGVAVATTLSHITASSISGAVAQWKKRAIDFKMAGVMMLGGIVGTGVGVWLFAIMRRAGQMDLVVSLTYVPMLGIIGGIMLNESLKTLRARHSGKAPARIYPVNHVWIHGLPLKARFRQSRLYISIIPPLVIGFVVGAMSAIMGVGGITKAPMVVTDDDGNDSIAVRSVVHLTLGYDHRLIDGAVADQFMAQVKKTLENWTEEIG